LGPQLEHRSTNREGRNVNRNRRTARAESVTTDRYDTVCRVTVEYLSPQPASRRIMRTGGRKPLRRTTSLPHTRITTLVDARGCCADVRITLLPVEPVEAFTEPAPAEPAPAEPAPTEPARVDAQSHTNGPLS